MVVDQLLHWTYLTTPSIREVFPQSGWTSALVGYFHLQKSRLYRESALWETSCSSKLDERSHEFRFCEKWPYVFTSRVASKSAVDRSAVRMLSILPAESETLFFMIKLKGDLSRAMVDRERTSSFSNKFCLHFALSLSSSTSSFTFFRLHFWLEFLSLQPFLF